MNYYLASAVTFVTPFNLTGKSFLASYISPTEVFFCAISDSVISFTPGFLTTAFFKAYAALSGVTDVLLGVNFVFLSLLLRGVMKPALVRGRA